MDNKLKQEIIDCYKVIGTKSGVARKLGIPRTTVRRVLDTVSNPTKSTQKPIKPEQKPIKSAIEYTDKKEIVIDVEGNETIEELCVKYNLNPKQWVPERISHNEWTTPFKNEDGNIEPFTNKQKKVTFKKVIEDITLDIIREQYKLMGEKNTYSPVVRTRDTKKKPVMYEIALFDMHLGKLC